MTWTDAETISTAWGARGNISTESNPIYNVDLSYDTSMLTYDGYYLMNQISWNQQSQVETAWAEN